MIISEFEEYDPIKLFWELQLSRSEFAELFGIERQSLDRWLCGLRKPNRLARRLAWELRQKSEFLA